MNAKNIHEEQNTTTLNNAGSVLLTLHVPKLLFECWHLGHYGRIVLKMDRLQQYFML
jgi:hypothetical protein